MNQEEGRIGWHKTGWGRWLQPSVFIMLMFGFSAGLPLLLIFSTLSVWLREAGVERSAVTFFSWAALGYSFKFVWAPLVDLLPLPLFSSWLGRRRGWLLLSQLMVILAILVMAMTDPSGGQSHLTLMALGAVLLGFSSATQDIVIDAYRIEIAEESMQALLASIYIAGYRAGMLVAGAGSLFLADWLGTSTSAYHYISWQHTYFIMAALMGCGLLTTLFASEPQNSRGNMHTFSASQYTQFFFLFCTVSLVFGVTFFFVADWMVTLKTSFVETWQFDPLLTGFLLQLFRFTVAVGSAILTGLGLYRLGLVEKEVLTKGYLEPVKEFCARYSAKTVLLILLLIGFYRLSDIVLGVVANLFYLDIGFSKSQIAGISKTFGLVMTLLGGFLGGVLTVRFGVFRVLFCGALLSSITNLLFMYLARVGNDASTLICVIGADNLSAGIATTAFLAYLARLTSVSFTAVQYAVFSSIMTLMPKLIGGYSGKIVASVGYSHFFLLTAIAGIPVIWLIWMVARLDDSTTD